MPVFMPVGVTITALVIDRWGRVGTQSFLYACAGEHECHTKDMAVGLVACLRRKHALPPFTSVRRLSMCL
jgi:hypothetical protein